MAAGRIVLSQYMPARDRAGRLVSGALLKVYFNRTTTAATIYADYGLTTPLANPVSANASGQFPAIYAEAGTIEAPSLYTLSITAADGSSIGNPSVFDNFQPSIEVATQNDLLIRAEAARDEAVAATENKVDLDLANGIWLPPGLEAVGRPLTDKLGDVISVKDYGDGTIATGGDDLAAIQKCIDENPAATIDFGNGLEIYKISAPIILTGPGREFRGHLRGNGCAINCDFDGSASDPDSAMACGIVARATSLGPGSDTSGFKGGSITGFNIYAPAHGAAIYMANSQQFSIENNTFYGGRYSVAMECCINAVIRRNRFLDYKNAGVALLMLNDTSRVWYAQHSGLTPYDTYFNDSPEITANLFVTVHVGGLAHILDHGSRAENTRLIQNNLFYNGTTSCNAYCYLSRSSQPRFLGNWTENIDFPVRVLATNAGEPGGGAGTIAQVTAAEPAGTYALNNFPDGFSYTAQIEGNFFARSKVVMELSGVTGGGPAMGVAEVGTNYSTDVQVAVLKSTQSGSQRVLDKGQSWTAASGFSPVLKSFSYNTYRSLAFKQATDTNDDAPAGEAGEYVEFNLGSGAAVSLTNNVVAQLGYIDLTPGDWEVWGTAGFSVSGATSNMVLLTGGASSNGSAFNSDRHNVNIAPDSALGTVPQSYAIPRNRRSVATTTRIYLVARAQFGVGTVSGFGCIAARRMR